MGSQPLYHHIVRETMNAVLLTCLLENMNMRNWLHSWPNMPYPQPPSCDHTWGTNAGVNTLRVGVRTTFPAGLIIHNSRRMHALKVKLPNTLTSFQFTSSCYRWIPCIPFHYARVPPRCMDCAIVSNFSFEKRSRHGAAKINYADGRHIWGCRCLGMFRFF